MANQNGRGNDTLNLIWTLIGVGTLVSLFTAITRTRRE